MAVNLNLPSRQTGTAEQQLNGLYSYLYQLVEALNVTLNRDTSTSGVLAKTGTKTATAASTALSDASSTEYQQLKSLIVKTASEVTGSMRKVVSEISEGYLAQDAFGTFEEYISSKVSAGAEGLTFEWDSDNRITTSIADYNEYLAESGVYLRLGIVKHNDDGTIESGIIVGKNFQRVTIDGRTYYTSEDVYALITADEISFWKNGVRFARLSLTGLVANQAYLNELTANDITANKLTAAIIEVDKLIASVIQSEGGDASLALDGGLLSAIAKQIDLTANESIKLAVNSSTAGGVVTGTGVTITDKEVIITIPTEDGEEGEEELSVDKDGVRAQVVTADVVHSPTVVRMVLDTEYTPANSGELEAILDELSDCSLRDVVTINAASVQGGNFRIHGVRGAQLNINGGTFNSLTVNDCHTAINITAATINAAGTAIKVTNSHVHLLGIAFNAQTGVEAYDSRVYINSCTGTCMTLVGAYNHSDVQVCGDSIPYGLLDIDNSEVYSTMYFEAAPVEPDAPTITTLSIPAKASRTWGDGWLSTSSFGTALYQGATGGGTLRRGCMWFDTADILGKHIISATLTMKRVSGIGGGSSVAVGIYGTTAASASGTPAIGTQYTSVALANGGTGTVDVTDAVQALADGRINGLMIYDSRTGTFSGKTYTYGYCKVYGSGESVPPTLNVTFE